MQLLTECSLAAFSRTSFRRPTMYTLSAPLCSSAVAIISPIPAYTSESASTPRPPRCGVYIYKVSVYPPVPPPVTTATRPLVEKRLLASRVDIFAEPGVDLRVQLLDVGIVKKLLLSRSVCLPPLLGNQPKTPLYEFGWGRELVSL